MVYCCTCVGVLVVVLLVILALNAFLRRRPISLAGKHALVTGGSSGIGKWCAIELVKKGANVTLFARSMDRLEEAKKEIEMHAADRAAVRIISVDISRDYVQVEKAVKEAEDEGGPISVLVNCAGFSIAARLEDIDPQDIRRLLDVNYMGSCFVTRAVLPGMKSQKWGRILFTSSQAGLLGVYGFTAYSASKFALRGLAETLQMEVKPYNIRVTLAFPPDTDTPGFAEEEKTKPLETRKISETSGLADPKKVAKSMLNDLMRGHFFSSYGIQGKMLSLLCAGGSPFSSVMELVAQVPLMGFVRLIIIGILYHFDWIVASCKQKRERERKES